MPHAHRRAATSAAIVLLSACLSAQRTWVVDAASGPGTDFTDLPAAFAAVRDGDRVDVRAGRYRPGRLDKAIRLVADDNAVVGLDQGSFEITGIAAGRTCVLHGLELISTPSLVRGNLAVRDNQGLVVLSGIRVDVVASFTQVSIQRCRAVAMTECTMVPGVNVDDAEVTAARCAFRPSPIGSQSPALSGTRARLDLAQCVALGFDGGFHSASTAAVRMSDSVLTLRGDGNSRFAGGQFGTRTPAPSIDGQGTVDVIADPAVQLVPAPVQLRSLTRPRLPSLTTTGGVQGRTLDLELYSPSRDPYVLAVAVPAMPSDLPFGRTWLDLPSVIPLVFGTQGPAEHTTHGFAVPNLGALRGLALGYQAASGVGGGLGLANAVLPVLR